MIRERFKEPLKAGAVEVKSLDRPGAGLIEYLDGRDEVILIDAMQGGAEPGSVRKVDLSELEGDNDAPSSHNFGVAEALLLAQAMGDLPRELTIIGIEVNEQTDEQQWGETLMQELKPIIA